MCGHINVYYICMYMYQCIFICLYVYLCIHTSRRQVAHVVVSEVARPVVVERVVEVLTPHPEPSP